MSERRPLTFEERQIRDDLRAARKAELFPALAALVLQGSEVYEQLRPKAQHVGTVPREYPLRHQQVHGWGLGSIVSDYVTVHLGSHHDLLIYKDFAPDQAPWKLTRTIKSDAGPTAVTETEVKQTPANYAHITGGYELEVSTYRHPERIGLNRIHTGFLSMWPDYENGEEYIQTFSEDLDRALGSHL